MNSLETFQSKYKPYYLADFCMNENVLGIIRTLFEIDDLNLLFIGATGSGKTTLLNAIVREYYGLAKTSGFPETNILFINNLKEQGVNYYRNEMKTFCQSKCSIFGKKKLIVIDDLDTVNEQCQQVFRNYIDKYKNNIHFVSLCTNVQKVIESIQSRLHIIKMPSPTTTNIENLMNYIIEKESLDIDETCKNHILKLSNDSFRLLINYLEKIYIYGEPVTIEIYEKMFSNHCLKRFENYIEFLKKGDLVLAVDELYFIYDQGYSVIDILDYFFTFSKTTEILDEDTKYRLVPILCKYITVFNKIHEDCIELALFTNELQHVFTTGSR